jgi:hypothetical protein
MMANGKVLISAGDVIEVQLTSETVVIESAHGRREEEGHITNRMRLFLKETNGGEKKYDFDDTELGVRETQRVAVVRAQFKRKPEPVNLILFNLSSGEHDTFEQGLAAHLGYKPFFGALWKAAAWSALVTAVFWFVSNFITRSGYGGLMSISLALMFGFLTYPVFWWICRTWDRVTERMRYRGARKRFIQEMQGRVQAYSPARTAAAAPQTQAAPAPSPSPAAPEPSPG